MSVVVRWSQLANDTAYKQVMEISEASQSITHPSSYFSWVVWDKLMAGSNRTEACSYQIHWLPSILSTQGTGKCGRTRYCPFYPSLSGWTACHTATTNRENTQQCHATAVPFTDSRVVPPSDQTKQDMPCHAPPSFTCTPAPARTTWIRNMVRLQIQTELCCPTVRQRETEGSAPFQC